MSSVLVFCEHQNGNLKKGAMELLTAATTSGLEVHSLVVGPGAKDIANQTFHYGATKAFVLSFTEALWQETKSTGVRIFALCPGATETEFFARTGEEFLTRGRQTSAQVVDVAMAAIDKSSPTVISGLRNAILANGYRIAPRRVMLEVAQRMVKAE